MLPIDVQCIVRDASTEHPVLKLVRERCEKLKVSCETRVYNSRKFSVDRDEIITLPAVHIFRNRVHVTTFYPIRDPIEAIDQIVELHHKKIGKEKTSWKKMLFGWLETKPGAPALTASRPPKVVEFK